MANKFIINKTYYLEGKNWKLKYLGEETSSLGLYHTFKVLEHDDPEDDWDEYSTGDGSEVLSSRADWLKTIKEEKTNGMSTMQSTDTSEVQEVSGELSA